MAQIKELGNCGNIAKLERIMKALELAIKNKALVGIKMDPLVYGPSAFYKFTTDEVKSYKFNKSDLFIGNSELSWWDIVACTVIF